LTVGIFDSISTIKTHYRVLEVNLYNRVACRQRFVTMIEVQMHLYKTDGVIPSRLCHFLVSILK